MTEGILTACLYSYGCPELKTIGAEKFIFDFLKNPEKSKLSLVTSILEKLEPFLFYQLIAKMNGITNPFNPVVVRAYWLDNKLLRTIESKDILSIPTTYFIKLSGLVGGKAHHNFGILWSAKKTENIPIEKVNDCLIKPGKVIEVKEKTVLVETMRLLRKGKRIYFEDSTQELSREIMRGLISLDDWISIHFGSGRERISSNCANNLIKITEEAIAFFEE